MSYPQVFRVAADGSADFRTVQEAIDAVPLSNRTRTVIQVTPGVYRQPIYVPKTKNFITLAGSCPENTVLCWDNTATRIDHHQVRINPEKVLPLCFSLTPILNAAVASDRDGYFWVRKHDCRRGGLHRGEHHL